MGELCSELEQEKSSTPRGFSWYTNMAAVSLFWNTNMAAVTSCENALYVLNSRSHTNDRHLRVNGYFIPLSLFEFLSLTFSLYFQLINFPLHERVLSQTLTPPILSFLTLIKTFLKCWSTLIVMNYTYIREPKAHFYDLHLYKRTFYESFINKSSLVINYC